MNFRIGIDGGATKTEGILVDAPEPLRPASSPEDAILTLLARRPPGRWSRG